MLWAPLPLPAVAPDDVLRLASASTAPIARPARPQLREPLAEARRPPSRPPRVRLLDAGSCTDRLHHRPFELRGPHDQTDFGFHLGSLYDGRT
jgi:hypothetical protein